MLKIIGFCPVCEGFIWDDQKISFNEPSIFHIECDNDIMKEIKDRLSKAEKADQVLMSSCLLAYLQDDLTPDDHSEKFINEEREIINYDESIIKDTLEKMRNLNKLEKARLIDYIFLDNPRKGRIRWIRLEKGIGI